MNKNVEHILSSLLREVRQDIKSVRDTLAPMQVDLKYHIKRTDYNENRIAELEEKHLEEIARANELAERRLRLLKVGLGAISAILGIAVALEKIL